MRSGSKPTTAPWEPEQRGGAGAERGGPTDGTEAQTQPPPPPQPTNVDESAQNTQRGHESLQ